MGIKYNNPKIMEAVCEFKFADDTKWDITIPGLIYEDVRAEFPKKTQRTQQEINISTAQGSSGKMQSQIRKSEIASFLTNNEKTLINIGPRTLSVNQMKPYLTWADFKSHIEYAFAALNKRVEISSIQRIGLRYINKIDIPGREVDLDNYFEFRPFLGPNLPQSHNNFILGCAFSFIDERDICKVQLRDVVPEDETTLAFLLDIDYYLAKPQSIAPNQSLNWVEQAHSEVEKIFEGCISESLREILGVER